jgi:dUTP pyrophosphatase
MARYFEKISFKQFKKDVSDDEKLYDSFSLPKRKTKFSAGYDLFALFDYTIKPNEFLKIPTGIKVKCEKDEVFLIVNRSSLGFKYNIRLVNQAGVIDSDYYNNSENEGHVFIKIQNEGNEEVKIPKDFSVAQGIFTKYLIVDNEEEVENIRTGGIGSTNEK